MKFCQNDDHHRRHDDHHCDFDDHIVLIAEGKPLNIRINWLF